MSTGDLSTEVEASGLKEVEVLSSSLNRMRMSLLAMMQRFMQSAQRQANGNTPYHLDRVILSWSE